MAVLKTTQETFDADVLKNNKLVFVDFFADWCGPCKMSAPIIEDLSQDPTYNHVEFMKIDVDANTDLASQLGVFSIPTFIAYYKGEPILRMTGAGPSEKFKEQLDLASKKAEELDVSKQPATNKLPADK